jgi:thiol:disulfide interchange protein DsbD
VLLRNAFPEARAIFSGARGVAFAAGGAAALGVLLGALHGGFGGSAAGAAAKGLGVALLVGGIVYAVGAADAREKLRGASLAWRGDEPGALALARAERRPVIVDFWADWCVACKELDRVAWADPRVRDEAARFVAVKVDGTDDTPEFQALVAKYGIVGMPTVVFIDGRGREVPLRVTAAISPDEMLEVLRAVEGTCDRAPVPARADALAAVAGAPVVACTARW